MKKIFSFSLLLILGLVASQILPGMLGESYPAFRAGATTFLYVCLSFIMINVGREFEIDKKTLALLCRGLFHRYGYGSRTLAAHRSVLCFRVVAARVLGQWRRLERESVVEPFCRSDFGRHPVHDARGPAAQAKLDVSENSGAGDFDDLDTILLMIPLQILMIGLRWQLFVVVVIVFLLLWLGWKKLSTYELRQDWWAILTYSVVVFGVTQLVYLLSKYYFGEEGSIHIEVLLPAFVLGMVMKTRHVESRGERMAASGISFLFMFLVGLSMPLFIGMTAATGEAASSVTGSQPMMSWGVIAFHVVIVSLLSNLGKLFPMFFYRDRKLSERLALSIGMFTRGEVGAGVIFIALGYSLGGPALVISVLTLVLNLVLTGIFVVWVKKLALRTYAPEEFDAVSTIR